LRNSNTWEPQLWIEEHPAFCFLENAKFFETFPCILVTGGSFADAATKRFVFEVSDKLNLPVFGLCDHNPHGLMVLHSYECGANAVCVRILGLLPTMVGVPEQHCQQFTLEDYKHLGLLADPEHRFHWYNVSGERLSIVTSMIERSVKVQLEAFFLNESGVCLEDWLHQTLEQASNDS
jgi:DNA topoisomerase VI subunit A